MGKKKSGETSKADMVRAALKDGIDNPEDGVAFIKEKFGIDMPRPTFSSYKSQEKARQEKKAQEATSATPAKRGRPKAASAPGITTNLPPSGLNGPAGLATSVEAIKSLCDQLGVDQVVSIARLFAK